MIGYQPRMPDLNRQIVDRIVRRIVETCDPQKIVLFGSRGRGEGRPESDIDLLIIGDSNLPRHRRTVPLYSALADLPIEVDVDVVVYTPEEVHQQQAAASAFVTTALRDGSVLYEKQP